jgi:hypothetical protein
MQIELDLAPTQKKKGQGRPVKLKCVHPKTKPTSAPLTPQQLHSQRGASGATWRHITPHTQAHQIDKR